MHELSRRARQIMEIIFARGESTTAEVVAAMPDAPSYATVRALLPILEEKGHLKHREDGPRYVFVPTEPVDKASRSALKQVVQTFFEGSLASAVAAEARDRGARRLDRLSAVGGGLGE